MLTIFQRIERYKFRKVKKQADFLSETENKKFFVFKGEQLVSLLKVIPNSEKYVRYNYVILSRRMIKTLTHNKMRYEDIRNAIYTSTPKNKSKWI